MPSLIVELSLHLLVRNSHTVTCCQDSPSQIPFQCDLLMENHLVMVLCLVLFLQISVFKITANTNHLVSSIWIATWSSVLIGSNSTIPLLIGSLIKSLFLVAPAIIQSHQSHPSLPWKREMPWELLQVRITPFISRPYQQMNFLHKNKFLLLA